MSERNLGTRRLMPHDESLGTEVRRENEKALVKSFLDGNMMHAGDAGAAEQEAYIQKAKDLHEDASVEDLASLALARKPKEKEVPYHSPELSTMDIERSKQLVNDAVLLSQEAQKRKPTKQKTSDSERAKIDESFYFRYEKLHDAQEDVEAARKELGVNLKEGNFLQIEDVLKDGVDGDKRELDEAKMGSLETFKKVQDVISALYVRKPHLGEVEADSPAYLQMIKRKLHESRVQVDDLRKKIKDLSAGLKVASLECKSAAQLLLDRNDELNRQRNTMNMLQLQIRNYKHRAVNANFFTSSPLGKSEGGGKADELMQDYEELRQENQDLIEINLVLEKEVRVLQVKAEFRGAGGAVAPKEKETAGPKSKFLEAVEEVQAQKRAEERKDTTAPMPTTQALKKLMGARRSWTLRLATSEQNTMFCHDFDAHPKPQNTQNILLQPAIRPRGMTMRETRDADNASNRTTPQNVSLPGPKKDGLGSRGSGKSERLGAVSPHGSHNTSPVPQALQPVRGHSVQSPRGSPRPNNLNVSRAGDVEGDIVCGWEQSSKAWAALRRKILGTVALSRADVMRREEAHVKKMRNRVTLLVSELSVANAEREMLLEKCTRQESENANVKSQLTHSQERVQKMMVLAGLSSGVSEGSGYGRGAGQSFGAVSEEHQTKLKEGGSGDVWKTPAGGDEATDELISEELTRLRTLKGKRKTDDKELTTAMEKQAEMEEQMKTVTDILNGKINRLESELEEKDSKINDLLHIVSQREAAGDTNNPLTNGAQIAASVMEGPDTESIRMKVLENEVLKKDIDVAATEQENKVLKVRLNAAEDQLTEERATTNLGLSRKTSVRVVNVLRRMLARSRERIEQRRLEYQQQAAEDDDEGPSTDAATGERTAVGREFRAPKSEDAVLKSKRVTIEENEDEEESVLRQVFQLAMNPQQKDIVSKQISALELTESHQLVLGGPVARREKEWFRARRLWLRLLTIREQAWQEAITEDFRRKLEARVTDTYEAFVKFEQADVTDSRPSMASNGILRVLSMAASPISDKTGLKSLDEVEREYNALAELVKTRNTQLLQLQSERDEAVASIDKLSTHKSTKKVAVPPSALSISHVIKKHETAASIAAQYGLTNHQLINELFEHAPRASMALDPKIIWLPIKTDSALDTCLATDENEPTLVVRHLVQDNETLGSIANKFQVGIDKLHQVGTDEPIDLQKVGGVPCVDVWCADSVAREYVMQHAPDTPTQQQENTVFAALQTDGIWGKVSLRAMSRIFNCAEFDLSLYNDALEEGQVIHVPLLLNKATMAQMPALVSDMKVHVWHTVRENDTKDSIADRYEVMASRLDGQILTVRGQVQVPLTSLPALNSVIQDPALIAAVDAVCEAEESGADVEEVLQALEEDKGKGGGGANVPLLPLDRGVSIRAQLKRLETRAGSVGALSRKNTLSTRSEPPETPRAHSDSSPEASPKREGIATPQENQIRADEMRNLAASPSVCTFGEENFSKTLTTTQRLLAVARDSHTLREEINVPNFTVANQPGTLWLARLRTADSLRRAREEGAEVHCLINLVDESVESVAKELSIAATLIFQHNEELEILDLQEKRFDYIRIPLINLRVQNNCLRRSGMFYAVVPTYGKAIEKVAANYAVAPSDFSAYHVELDPKNTPKIFFNRFPRAYDAAEHRMSFTLPIDGLDYSKLKPDAQQQLLMALEVDTLGVAEFAAALGVEGNVLGTSVTDVIRPNRFTVQVFCDTFEMATAVKKVLIDDGVYTTMENTQRLLVAENMIPADTHVKLSNNSHHLHQFTLKSQESTVVGVDVTTSLTDIAMYHGVGVETLYAFNNSLSLSMELPNTTDGTPQSVLGVDELSIPNTQDKVHAVSSTDTLQEIAIKSNCSVEELRRLNIRCLPLAALVSSIRVPVLPHISRPSMIIKAQAEESFLALCTRFGVDVDSVRADYVTISHGTELKMPPIAGFTTKLGARSRLPNVNPKQRSAERGETAESIAEETGLISSEVIVANPSRVRIMEGASVHVPVITNTHKVLTTRPTSSESAERGGAGVGHVKREGLFVRHKVTGDETLSKIAGTYFQPVTAVLSSNSSLFHIPGAHLILIPLPDEEKDEILVAQVQNVCTIVIPGPQDSMTPMAGLARRFNVDIEKVKDINSFMNDEKHIVMPLVSGVAVSLARQQNLQLYAAVQLQQGETLVSLADRYNVFVKDLIVLGKPLARLGVGTIDVPVAFDVAKKMQQTPEHKDDRIMLASELRPGEQLKTFLNDVGAGESEVRVHDTSSTYTEVVLSTVKGLETARDRETERLSERSKLIDRTMAIGQALRQLTERNDATGRELEKVSTIRDSNKELAINHQMAMNLESIGVQTEEAKIEARGKMNQRNGMVQTKLSGQQYDYLEQTVTQHVADIEGLTMQRNDLDRKNNELQAKVEAQQARILEIGVQLTERTDRLNGYLNRTPGTERTLIPTPPEGGNDPTSGIASRKASGASASARGTPPVLAGSGRISAPPDGMSVGSGDGGGIPSNPQSKRPSTREDDRPGQKTDAGTRDIVYSTAEVQCTLLTDGMSTSGRSPMLGASGRSISPTGGQSKTPSGHSNPSTPASSPRSQLPTSADMETQTPGTEQHDEGTQANLQDNLKEPGSKSRNPSLSGSLRGRDKDGSLGSSTNRSRSNTKTGGKQPAGGASTARTTGGKSAEPAAPAPAPAPVSGTGGTAIQKLNKLTAEHSELKMNNNKLKNAVKTALPVFNGQAKRLAFDVQALREEFLSLFNGLSDTLATEILPLTTWSTAEFGVAAAQKAQDDEDKRNQNRVLEGVKLVSRNLVPHLNESFTKAHERRLESTLLTDDMTALLDKVSNPEKSGRADSPGGDDEEAWVAKQLGSYVKTQVAEVVHAVATGETPPNEEDTHTSWPRASVPTRDTACDPMTPLPGVSNVIQNARRQVATPDKMMMSGGSLSGRPGGPSSQGKQQGSINLPSIQRAPKSASQRPEREKTPSGPALSSLLGKIGNQPVTPLGHLYTGTNSRRGSNRSPLPGVVGEGKGGSLLPPSNVDHEALLAEHVDPITGEALDYLLMKGEAVSETEEERRKRAKTKAMNVTNFLKRKGSGSGSQIDDEYDRIQGGVAQLVAGELDPPEIKPHLKQQVQQEVVPVFDVINQLAAPSTKMAAEQRAAVNEIRRVDRTLMRQQAQAHFKTLGGKIRVKSLLKRVTMFEGDMDYEDVAKVQGLWKKWLHRWTGVQKRLRDKRRENMQRLLSVFIQDETQPGQSQPGSPYTVSSPGGRTVRRVPAGNTYGAAYGAPNNGIIVLRPFRAGSKLRPMKPTYRNAPVPALERSSAHFNAVTFDMQD